MTPTELVQHVRCRLAAMADSEFRETAQKFSREPVNCYGVRAPLVQALAREVYPEVKSWPTPDRDRFAEALWRGGRIEEAAVVIYVYRRMARQFGVTEFRLFERWIDRYVDNWGSCDGVSAWLLAGAIANHPELVPELKRWTASTNRWKRRAAAVALVQEARRGSQTTAVLDVAGRLIEDPDDLVRKGVGWLLKEAYPKKPRDLVRFLREHGASAPRLVLRLAAEKMTPHDRAAVGRVGRRPAQSTP